jgi:hypothetical protein
MGRTSRIPEGLGGWGKASRDGAVVRTPRFAIDVVSRVSSPHLQVGLDADGPEQLSR